MVAAVCVLGCRPGSGAFARRAKVARDVYDVRQPTLLVACGGRDWGGRIEADELARLLEDGGIPSDAILRERVSLDTRGNALEAARLLRPRGIREVVLVTCTWHLPRARRLFERAGLEVVGTVGALPPNPTLLARVWWASRERVSTWKDAWT